MRIIKFRAWDKESGMYYTDGLCVTDNGALHYFYYDLEKCDPERFVIQQFTGLLDKNGKEIYEGDIVSLGAITVNDKDYPIQGIVQWHYYGFIIGRSDGHESTLGGTPLKDVDPWSKYEVIGNIFETSPQSHD